MGESNSATSTAGVSGVGVVQIVFIILKLCKTQPIGGWPWWKVMLPLECSVALVCCLGCCILGVGSIAFTLSKDEDIPKPGAPLTEDQLRAYEATFNNNSSARRLTSNETIGSSQATTSPATHTSNNISMDDKYIGPITIDEDSENNV